MPRTNKHKTPAPYPAHLQSLLSLGDPRIRGEKWRDRPENWTDYRTLGLAESDAPELIRVASDMSLHRSPAPRSWAPLHAWRALGQFRDREAIKPLIELLDTLAKYDDDWGLEELPEVIATLGPDALPDLKRFIPDQRRNMWARIGAARAMTNIARADVSYRTEVIDALKAQLDLARYNSPDFNGYIVSKLIDLKAVDAVSAIQRAYEAGHVEEMVCGPLEDVLEEIGMTQTEIPLPDGEPVDQAVVAEVMTAFNAKLKNEPKSKNPLSRAEHEKIMRELTSMLQSRLAGGPLVVPDENDPKFRAQDLAYQAADAPDRDTALALLDKALALDPDCVDALAQGTALIATTEQERLDGFRHAVQAGERSLGAEFSESARGQMWGHIEARPYLRARIRLANALRELPDQLDAAIGEYEAILELDSDDHNGVRYALVGCYLERGDTKKIADLAFRFDETSAFFLWPETLAHVLDGDHGAAEECLEQAREENPHVESFLTEAKPLPADRPMMYSPGGADEAVFVAENVLPAIRVRPALREWLVAQPR